MQQVDLKVWKEQKAFRDWDYEKQQAHEQATKMLHKVPRPTGKQYLRLVYLHLRVGCGCCGDYLADS